MCECDCQGGCDWICCLLDALTHEVKFYVDTHHLGEEWNHSGLKNIKETIRHIELLEKSK